MPERPIKKSERQANSAADGTTPPSEQDQPSTVNPDTSASVPEQRQPSSAPRPVKKGDAPPKPAAEKREKRNDRGKKEPVDAAPTNLALMRGPKPPKPSAAQPIVEETPETETSEAEPEAPAE
ncbi:MAG TPA: hypothetical protein VL134_05600 [Leptolyngbya sp.]|nr:hypothetical protein [Leptolyngbya sp.]